MDVDPSELEDTAAQQTKQVGQAAKDLAGEAKEKVKEGYQKVKSFKQTVDIKAEQEKQRPGWQSGAFDVRA